MPTTSEIAARAGCSPWTVQRRIRDGELAAQREGRIWVISEKDGAEFVRTFRRRPYGPRRGHAASGSSG
jgi:excisionase family DNA binding protein